MSETESTYTFDGSRALAAYEQLCDDFEPGPVMLAIRALVALSDPLTESDMERVRASIDPQKKHVCEGCGKASHVVSDEPPRLCPDCLASMGVDPAEASMVAALTAAREDLDPEALTYYQKVLRDHRRIDVAIGKANERILALHRQIERAEKIRDDLIEDLRAVGREAPLFGDPETTPEVGDLTFTQDRTREHALVLVEKYGADRFMRALRRRGINGFEKRISIIDLRRALADLKAEGEDDGDGDGD